MGVIERVGYTIRLYEKEWDLDGSGSESRCSLYFGSQRSGAFSALFLLLKVAFVASWAIQSNMMPEISPLLRFYGWWRIRCENDHPCMSPINTLWSWKSTMVLDIDLTEIESTLCPGYVISRYRYRVNFIASFV